MSAEPRSHSLERTSPKGPGQKFYGRCVYCGKGGLRPIDATKPCDAPEHPGQDDALIEAIRGHERSPGGGS